MPSRFRADLADVAWAKEHEYGIPTIFELAELITAGGTSLIDKLRGQWGLVTGGIDLPNPTFDWQPFYGLGVMNRNMLFPVQGRERLEGRVSQTLLCHDSSRLFLEQCIGLIFNAKNDYETYYGGTTYALYDSNTSSGTSTITYNSFTVASKDFNTMTPANVAAEPSHIVIVGDETGSAKKVDRTQDTWAYIGPQVGSVAGFEVYKDQALSQAGWNGIIPPSGANTKFSIHGIAQNSSATGPADASNVLNVTRDLDVSKVVFIRPTLVQPSFTLGARFRADDGSTFITNYNGCKVSRVVFNFEEGNPVNFGADFIARDMSHNIGQDEGITTPEQDTLKYKAQWATGGSGGLSTGEHVNFTVSPNYMKDIRVVEQPYFYSTVKLTFQGEPIARFRRFSITIDNGLDPRYYVTQNGTAQSLDNRQILHEILEGRRNISFAGSLDLDNDGSNAYPRATSATDAQFVRYLLNQGMTGADARDLDTLKGIGIEIELRQVNTTGTAGTLHNVMKFKLPSNTGTGTGNVGYGTTTSEVGMVLRSAPMNVPAPPSVHVPMDIDGMASSMHIEIYDGVAWDAAGIEASGGHG